MSIITEKIIQKIQFEHIQPLPKKFFLLKQCLIWLCDFLLLILSGFLTAVIIFLIKNQDWDIAQRFTIFKPLFIFFILPYFWLILLLAASALVYYNYRHTKYGYRLKFSLIIFVFLVFNLTFGFIFYQLDIGHALEEKISNNFTFYHQINNNHLLWQAVDKGLLAGQVIAQEKNNLTILDFEQNIWQISLSEKITYWPIINEKIKIIGQRIGERKFLAEEIRPWCGCQKCLNNQSSCAIQNQPTNNTCSGNCAH